MWVGVHETSKRIRYRPCLLYSPILFDSQELSSFYLPHDLPAHAGAASPVTTIPTKLRGSAMEWRCRRLPAQLPGSAAGAATTGNYGDRACADGQWKCRLEQLWFRGGTPAPGYYGSWASASGNGECRRISRTCCQGRWSCTMSIAQ